jgi:hypothetical protein
MNITFHDPNDKNDLAKFLIKAIATQKINQIYELNPILNTAVIMITRWENGIAEVSAEFNGIAIHYIKVTEENRKVIFPASITPHNGKEKEFDFLTAAILKTFNAMLERQKITAQNTQLQPPAPRRR